MDKKIVFLAFFVLLLAGCLGKQGQLEKIYGAGPSSPAKFCMSEANESDPKFYECIVNLAIGVGNSSLCEEVFSESPNYEMLLKRDSCLFRAEQVGHEQGACLRIGNSVLRDYCTALASSNPESCLSLEENKRACVLRLGGMIVAGGVEEVSSSCIPVRRSECLLGVARDSGNPTTCEMIEKVCDAESSAQCRSDFDNCFILTAERSGNASICKNLAKRFFGAGHQTYDPEGAVAECSLRAFNSTQRLASCMELVGKQRGECIAQYAVSVGSPELCTRIGEELRGTVAFPVEYAEYAKPHGDWSAFSISKIHDECITNLAVSLRKPSLCEGEFLSKGGNSLCYFESAVSLNDKKLCEKISDKDARDSCQAQLK